jgi:hypothetical protein
MPTLDVSPETTLLILYKAADFFYDIEFWDRPEDEGGVKVPLVDAWGVLQSKYDDADIIDFADWITCVEGTAELRLTGEEISLHSVMDRGVYQLFGRTDADEVVLLMHGPAQIREDT